MRILCNFIIIGSLLLPWTTVRANERDARNFITVATGSVPSSSDPKIKVVEKQLDAIQAFCATTSKGAAIHDKLGKAHSLLRTQQSLLQLLADFVGVAKAQCRQIDDVTLITLYLLERNSGATHAATIMNLTKNPRALAAKWSSR